MNLDDVMTFVLPWKKIAIFARVCIVETCVKTA